MRRALPRFFHTHEGRLLVVVVALGVFLSFATASFATLQNAVDLLTSYAFSGMLAAGLLVVLVSGGIDISFTATASVAQYMAMSVANAYPIGWLGVDRRSPAASAPRSACSTRCWSARCGCPASSSPSPHSICSSAC